MDPARPSYYDWVQYRPNVSWHSILDSRENRGSSLDTRLDSRFAILAKTVDVELSRLCRLDAGCEKMIYFLWRKNNNDHAWLPIYLQSE